MVNKIPTPFPRPGELLRFFAAALDTRSSATTHADKLDRCAQDKHCDPTEVKALLGPLIGEPLEKLDPDLGAQMEKMGSRELDTYFQWIRDIPADPLERSDIIEILVDAGGVPALTRLVDPPNAARGGPDLIDFLNQDRPAVIIVFDWFVMEIARKTNIDPEQAVKMLQDWYTPAKPPDDQKKAADLLKNLSRSLRHDPINGPALQYQYEWMSGRHHLLSGRYKAALKAYHQAFEYALYRAGETQI
jgi:hypothetical protein